ncbi:MAG TPA: hypothetical protein ENK66_01575 [Arcobacter sp.]|jgi:hypothetical protein|nr:hypothetical protein [Arcobacter sp.]
MNKIDISSKKLEMERNGYIYKLTFYIKTKMLVETFVYKESEFIKKEQIPFAQLTKKLKKVLNP